MTAIQTNPRRSGHVKWSVLAEDRLSECLASMFSLLAYALAFYWVYRDYVSLTWGYAGLRFSDLNNYELFAIAVAIGVQGWAMPKVVNMPSSVIIWMLTVIIYVPTMIITLMIGERNPSIYYGYLAAISVSMYILSINSKNVDVSDSIPLPPREFFYYFLIVFIFSALVLYYQYGSIMSFSSIEDVYFQRFAASDMGANSLIGYIRTYYLYVFSSFLFASGFLDRKYWYLSIVGFSGYVLTYMIDASKISFVIPIIMISFVVVRRFGRSKAWVLNSGLAMLTLVSGSLASLSAEAKLIADLVLVRSIAIPAQTFALYADVFDSRGYTWWSNVRGISAFVAPPQSFVSDPFWPVLGQIVGADYYGAASRANLNANLFVGEGVAAAGSFGVIAIGLVLVIYLRIFDALALKCNQRLAILAAVPLALSLTNTHLSTLLLSFGGFFWLAVLYVLGSKRAGRR